ncbi:MAG: DUF86 domain-containing protein, partial [bacterium]|nr:DUF86 domain-containing protein [bacterium]
EIFELEKLSKIPMEEFSTGDGWKLAQFHLHRALEGVFNITSHILSRIPGGAVTQYREMAEKLGEYKIVTDEFAKTKLSEMAKYRNRLVHFYAQITPTELYGILQNDLGDFDVFLGSVRKVLEQPDTYGVSVQ